MNNLLTWRYWFTLRPEALTPIAQKLFLGFLALLALLAVITVLIKRQGGLYRGFLKSFYGFCLGNAIIGLTIFFFDYELIPFFSARFWVGLWIISMLVWLVFVIKKLKKIPLQKKEIEEKEEIKKYLP